MQKQTIRWIAFVVALAAAAPMWSMGVDTEANPAAADLPAGGLSVGGRFTDFVQEFGVDALVPVWYREWGTDAGMVFVNPRGTFEESAEQEANFGVGYRHLWGDAGVIAAFLESVRQGQAPLTSAAASLESHPLAFAAEEARVHGKIIDMERYRDIALAPLR